MEENFAFRTSDGVLAVTIDGEKYVDIKVTDKKLLAEIDDLIRERQEIGLKITKKLQDHGFPLTAAGPTKVG